MISNRDHLYDLVRMFLGSSLKDEEDICKLNDELMDTKYYLISTQSYLLEYNMEIDKIQQVLRRSHIFSCTLVNHYTLVDDIQSSMEEPHEMVVHEVHDDMHVLEEFWDTDYECWYI